MRDSATGGVGGLDKVPLWMRRRFRGGTILGKKGRLATCEVLRFCRIGRDARRGTTLVSGWIVALAEAIESEIEGCRMR